MHSKRKFAKYESQIETEVISNMAVSLHEKANQIADPCVTIGSFVIDHMKLDRFFVDLVLTGQMWEQM